MNGMGQIATLADRLSTMSDQMLPQLAQQYKDDAITLSLILNEKNRRDRVRQTAQANPQQALQQPKVNDQVVASMQPQQLPENVGIGTLPTPNIDNMAAGGLVAFADGGDVERYNSQGSVPGGWEMAADYATVPAEIAAAGVPVMAYRQAADVAARMGTSVGAILKSMGYEVGAATGRGAVHVGKAALSAPAAMILAGGIPATKFATQTMAANPKLREAYTENEMLSAMDPDAAIAAAILNNAAPEKNGQQSTIVRNTPANVDDPSNLSGMDRRLLNPAVSGPMPRIGAADAQGNKTPLRTTANDGGKRAADRTNTAISSLAKPGQGADVFSVEGLKNIQNQLSGDSAYQVGEMRNQIVGMNAEDERQAEERLAAERKRQTEEGDVYKGRGERIAAREAALGKQGEENKGLAFLNAGLAIMASRGPVGEAIGKGAQIGTAQYASGIEKLRIAQERLEEAKDRTEELRLNRSDMNQKEIRTLERERDQAVLRGKKALYDFASNRYNLDRATTDKLVSSLISANTTKYAADTQAGATLGAAQIRATADKESMLELRGGTLVNNARKTLRDTLVKKYPYADEATINRLFETEWQKELQNNPALAKYAAESTTGGGRASSADPLGLR